MPPQIHRAHHVKRPVPKKARVLIYRRQSYSDPENAFAPNHRLREQITPARHGRRKAETIDEPAPARHVSTTPDQVRGRLWAQRLKRVFKIDIETCAHCGGTVKVIASIEDPAVIKQILEHLERRAESTTPALRPFARAPPPMATGPEETRPTVPRLFSCREAKVI